MTNWGAVTAYEALRNLAFQRSRAGLGLPAEPNVTEPWAVIMDWALETATVTVAAFANGDGSIYLRSGRGFISRPHSHETIRNAAIRMVTVARECQPLAQPALEHPLPERGNVKFYFLTDAGVFVASAVQAALTRRSDPMTEVWTAGQALIGEYPLVSMELPG